MSVVAWFFDGGMALARWVAGLRGASIRVGKDRWDYLDNGGAGPAVVLVHGFAANKESWLKVAIALKRSGLRLVVPDLPGFGSSPPAADGDYTIQAQAARLHAFAQALGLKRFHLVGHSMGGYVVGGYVKAHPGDLLSAYLVAPAGVGDGVPAWIEQRMQREGRNPLIVRSVAELREAMALAMAKPLKIPAPIAQLLVDREAPHHGLRVAQSSFWLSGPLEAMLKNTAVRLRMAWGELDKVLPVADALAVLQAVPGASLWRIPAVGHMPPEECAKALAGDLQRFITASS